MKDLANEMKNQLRRQVAEDDLESVYSTLLEITANPEWENLSAFYNDILSSSGHYYSTRQSYFQRTISHDNHEMEKAKARQALLNFINQIDGNELLSYARKNTIFQSLLIICKKPERIPELKKLFPVHRWPFVDFAESEDQYSLEQINNYGIVIYDNEPFEETPTKVLDIIQEDIPKPLVLCYSKRQMKIPQELPQRYLFANSPFTIHARLNDLILYLKNV
jgi:hypothetical protein